MGEVSMRPKNTKMTEEKLRKAVSISISISEALKNLDMSITTGNYRSFHKYVKIYNIDTSHFLGQKHLLVRSRNTKTTIPLEEILVENSEFLGIAQLKRRLIREGILRYECYECGIFMWRGKKISLQLDHINGIHNDHRIENLRFLCPNCHSQTETYCGKNKKSFDESKLICECGNKKSKDSKVCKKCDSKNREKIDWPNHKDLLLMVNSQGYEKTAKDLGVTRMAVVFRLEKYCALTAI
jgi:hypothetical protein